MKRHRNGQAILLVVVALGIFLVGALGLAMDVSQIYFHQQLAQVAADAAAQAAALSIYQGETTTLAQAVATNYASMNGFKSPDTVNVIFQSVSPTGCAFPGGSTNGVCVVVNRSVSNSFTRLIGAGSLSTTGATAIAATLSVVTSVPLLITDPNNSGSLSMNGTTGIRICGGPTRSIQINSKNNGYTGGGGVDLSVAGPPSGTPPVCDGTVAKCCVGSGADFGTFGGPAAKPSSINLGTAGHYLDPASPISDPLAFLTAPAVPSAAPAPVVIHSPTDGCTAANCTEYSPGLYVGGLNIKNDTVIFKPGLYYMQGGGFTIKNTSGGGPITFNGLPTGMCTGCATNTDTGSGMVIYDTGPSGSTPGHNPAGGFTFDTGTSIFLVGATKTTVDSNGNTIPAAPYYSLLLWEDTTANANSHTLGQGNASFAWTGIVYITNTQAIMKATASHVQSVTYNGGPSGTTVMQGYVIVSQLSMVGNTTVSMYLPPWGFLIVQQVALVGGGPHF